MTAVVHKPVLPSLPTLDLVCYEILPHTGGNDEPPGITKDVEMRIVDMGRRRPATTDVGAELKTANNGQRVAQSTIFERHLADDHWAMMAMIHRCRLRLQLTAGQPKPVVDFTLVQCLPTALASVVYLLYLPCRDAGLTGVTNTPESPDFNFQRYDQVNELDVPPLMDLVTRLHYTLGLCESTLVIAYMYVERFLHWTKCPLTCLTVRRLFLVASQIASKYHDDFYLSNVAFARYMGLKLAELNVMEVDFVFAVQFDLHVQPADFIFYYHYLVTCVRPPNAR